MDLQPSAPHASASSFPSPDLNPNPFHTSATDPLLSLEKLHDFCQGGGSTSSVFSKLQFPNFNASSKASKAAAGVGIDLTPELFSAAAAAASWGATATTAQERIRSSTSPYFSPNKIAHRSPGATVGGGTTDCSPPSLPAPPISGYSTLQGILQRCGLGSGTTLDLNHNKNHHHHHHQHHQQQRQDGKARPPTPACITQKIRNLDEILRNLDHYSMSKKFTISTTATKKEMAEPFAKKGQAYTEPDTVEDKSSEQPMMISKNAEHNSSGTLGGSVIPDGITHINKSISRMEFRAQMEKLTGIIDDRWPGDRRFEKVERMETTIVGGHAPSSFTSAEPSSVRNVQEQQQQPQVDAPIPPPAHLSATNNGSAASTNILEEMLRNISGLERRLAKRERSQQTKHKGFFARGRLWVQRPAGKRMAAVLQKQFKRHAACINQRLDKTDLAIKSLRRQRREALSPYFAEENNYYARKKEKKVSRASRSGSNIRTGSLNDSRDISSTASEQNLAESRQPSVAEKCMEACEALSRNMQNIQEQLCTLQQDSQQMGESLQQIQKQSSEQNMELELCWTAINHLCIDNQAFREELHGYHHSDLQQQQEQEVPEQPHPEQPQE